MYMKMKKIFAIIDQNSLCYFILFVHSSTHLGLPKSGHLLHKLTIDGSFAINNNYHGNRAQRPIKFKVSLVVTIDGKVTINGKFCAKGRAQFGQILSVPL